MDSIGKILKWQIEFFGKTIEYSPVMLLMTWIVMVLIVVIAFLSTRKMKKKPGKLQLIMEMYYNFFKDLTYSTLGEELAEPYVPYISTLFLFILFSNYLGIIPPFFHFFYLIFHLLDYILPIPDVAYHWMLYFPVFQEPTKFLSTTLGLGLLSAVVVHVSAIRIKGIVGYLRSYMDPLPSHGLWLLMFWINPFFYLNVIGELSKVVSHSFRLFGNILGGSIIITIISYLMYSMIPVIDYSSVTLIGGTFQSVLAAVFSVVYVVSTTFLGAFFGLFAGSIQAFVFAMLAVTYLAVSVKE